MSFIYRVGSSCKVWPELFKKKVSTKTMMLPGSCRAVPCRDPMPECSTATAAQCWSPNHAFLKTEKEDVCLAAVHAWSFPGCPDQKASSEQEGGPALMHPTTLLSPNLYFLGSLTCMPFFLSSLPTPFYVRPLSPCPFPIAQALLFGTPSCP